MAHGFQDDSCSTTAQTSSGDNECAWAALRVSAANSGDGLAQDIPRHSLLKDAKLSHLTEEGGPTAEDQSSTDEWQNYSKAVTKLVETPVSLLVGLIDVEEAHRRLVLERDAQTRANELQRVIKVREMHPRHV